MRSTAAIVLATGFLILFMGAGARFAIGVTLRDMAADFAMGRGTLGIIASMSQPFCSSCSRLRLTAEGKIMPCLHSPLEFDVRRVLRQGGTDREIAATFRAALDSKPMEHPGAQELLAQSSRVMIQIGG